MSYFRWISVGGDFHLNSLNQIANNLAAIVRG
jgi:hypothetical protein